MIFPVYTCCSMKSFKIKRRKDWYCFTYIWYVYPKTIPALGSLNPNSIIEIQRCRSIYGYSFYFLPRYSLIIYTMFEYLRNLIQSISTIVCSYICFKECIRRYMIYESWFHDFILLCNKERAFCAQIISTTLKKSCNSSIILSSILL